MGVSPAADPGAVVDGAPPAASAAGRFPSDGRLDPVVHLLGLALLGLGIGRSWQLWAFSSPFYAPLQSEHEVAPLLAPLGISWEAWIDPAGYAGVPEHLATLSLVLYLVATAAALCWWLRPAWRASAPVVGGLRLFAGLGLVLALCRMTDANNQVGMLVEHGGQVLLPLIAAGYGRRRPAWRTWARISISATFLGHGLYVLGWYPLPGQFPTMVMRCLGVGESTAMGILHLAGVLDMVVAVGIWFPRVALPCLLWAGIWGLLTALARPWHSFDPAFFAAWAHDWLHQGAVRLAHGATPLALWWAVHRECRTTSVAETPTCTLAST